MSVAELQQLLQVLDDRNINLGHDDIAWAFESVETRDALTSWVRQYLHPTNLLTGEELTFYEKYGTPASQQDVTGRPISDEEFESAISALEASTAAIDKQCRVLEAQKQALRKIKAFNSTDPGLGSTKSQRLDRLAHNRADLELETDQLVDSLQSHLQSSLKKADVSSENLPLGIERIFEKDDRLLDGLEKILPRLSDTNNSSPNSNELEGLCQALSALSAREIRSRIDAAYDVTVRSVSLQPNGAHKAGGSGEQHESLRAELEELCREIDGLASMAVDNEYRAPLSKALEAARTESEAKKSNWASYLRVTLQYLVSRLQTLDSHSQHLQTHNNALKSVSSTLNAVLATKVETTSGAPQTTSISVKSSQKGLKPLRLVQANFSETQDPTAQLLRLLDVKNAVDPSNTSKFHNDLQTALKENKDNLSNLSANTQQSISALLAVSLSKADTDVEALLGAVYAHSSVGKDARLVSSELNDMIESLDLSSQEVGDEMRQLDFDELGKAVKTKQQAVLHELST